MITGAFIIWMVFWRYRVLPANAEQHCAGTNHYHTVIYGSGGPEYCLNCRWRPGVRPPFTWWCGVVTALAALATVALAVIGAELARGIEWLI